MFGGKGAALLFFSFSFFFFLLDAKRGGKMLFGFLYVKGSELIITIYNSM